jgi:hypothetical protein
MAADSREVLQARFRALSRIKIHRRIERVKAHLPVGRVMKSAAGKGLKDDREGDTPGAVKSVKSKN